jgi:hypothetical protein
MIYKGSCHCGRISYEVEGDFSTVVECNCSICSKRGYLLGFIPRQKLKLLTPESNLSTYTFNTHKVKHRFCSVCGCSPFGEGADKTGAVQAAVNVRCLDDFDLSNVKRMPFDGRSL